MLGRALAIGVATAAYGFAFGALAVATGLSALQALAMSGLVFTGATQLAVVGVIAAGGGFAGALGNGLLLSLRHIAYGMAVGPLLRRRLAERALGAQLVIDESTAMATAQADPESGRRAFWLTGISVFVFWNASTLAGALLGDALASPRALGLDAVFPAAFVALLAPQLRRARSPLTALAGAAIAAALVPFAPPGVPILAAVPAVLLLLDRA